MDILSYGKLNEISKLVSPTKQYVKSPKTPLKFKLVGEGSTLTTGVRYLTTGWHDKVLYGIFRMNLYKCNKVDDATTWEKGVSLPYPTYGTIRHLHVSNNGIVLISQKDGENPKVYYMRDINSTPELRHEFLFNNTKDPINIHSVTGHYDGINDYLIVSQYGMGVGHTRDMYFSRDMGATWKTINTSIVDDNKGFNAHWHTAKYDPYTGRIWAAQGDNLNSAISYSDDFGGTWKRFSGRFQPTFIYPFPKRVIFGRDRGTAAPGIDSYERNSGDFSLDKLVDNLTFRPDQLAFVNYPNMQVSGYGDELYVRFPAVEIEEQYIFATGDGGETWHCVYSGKHVQGTPAIGNPSGVTVDGKIAFPLFNYKTGDLSDPLVYSDAVEWL